MAYEGDQWLMAYLDERLIQRARDFLKGHNPSVIIVYHGDGDGCCAAYFLQKFLDYPVSFYWVATPDFDFLKAENYLIEKCPSLSIFLDLPVYHHTEMIDKLGSEGKVFIYDHHQSGPFTGFHENPNLLYMNPVVQQDGQSFPAVLFGWEILEEKDPLDKEVLFMGLFTETWLDRVSLFQDWTPIQQERLKEIAKRIHAHFLIHDRGTTHYALDFLFQACHGHEGFKDVQNLREYQILENIYELLQNEKTWLLKRVSEEIARFHNPRFILKRIESRMRLCGLIASELRWTYPSLVIGIWQQLEDRYYCELRRGKECAIDLASLIYRVKSEVKLITGGGHPSAAGFTAKGEHFFEALKNIRTCLTE